MTGHDVPPTQGRSRSERRSVWFGLRARVALVVAVVSALATTTVGLLAYQVTESRLIEEIDDSIEQAANVLLARPARLPIDSPGGRGRGPRVFIPERLVGIDQFAIQVLGPDGAVLDASEGVALPVDDTAVAVAGSGGSAALATATDTGSGASWRVLTVGIDGGAVQVARDLAETDAVLDDLGGRITAIVILVTAAGAAVGWLLAVGVTGRIRRLAGAAERIEASGDLNVEVPTAGNDEAGRLGRAFDGMLRNLRDSRRRQQQLVEDAGHELRTPLTSLRTNLDVLRRHDDLPEGERAAILDDLDRDTSELAELVDEVVAVAANRHSTEGDEQLRLADLAGEVARNAERRSGREVTVDADDTVAVVARAAVTRAIANLVDNAVKFAPDGPVAIRVEGGRVSVVDHGPGIPDGELDAVFERFHRSPDARALPGSGLGLAIVATVATEHGATVFARNRAEGGSEVGFVLPAVRIVGQAGDGTDLLT